MAAAATSYFSGTALMPSQRVDAAAAPNYAAAPSPYKSCDYRFSRCVPATILHIARSFAVAVAADGGGDPILDDGTGKMALVRWITNQPDVREMDYIQDGVYLKVHVNLMGFQVKKQGFARSIR